MLAVANKSDKLKKDATGIYNQAINNTSDNMLVAANKADQLKKDVTGVKNGTAALINAAGRVAGRGAKKLGNAASETIINPIKTSVQKKYESVEKQVANKVNQAKTEVIKVADNIDKGVKSAGDTVLKVHQGAVN